jgi:hypothetical protein
MSMDCKEALETIKAGMAEDFDYAWAWHCNIAVSAVDAGCDHAQANDGAARFMRLCFDVDTSKAAADHHFAKGHRNEAANISA